MVNDYFGGVTLYEPRLVTTYHGDYELEGTTIETAYGGRRSTRYGAARRGFWRAPGLNTASRYRYAFHFHARATTYGGPGFAHHLMES